MSKKKFNRTKLKDNNNPKIVYPDTIQVVNYDYPIFCFRHLHKNYNLDNCDEKEKSSLIEQMAKLSQLTWKDIQNSNRHGIGSEKIAVNSIKTALPKFITEDVEFLLALRFQGKKPFLVHRDRFICHVIFIDNKFTVYNH
ncbi:MAG: hypothetical protein AB7O47_09115 [Flavobacteriales bacterium]